MTSTKELFAPALCYIQRDIQDCKEILESSADYKERIIAKYGKNTITCQLKLNKINNELREIKLKLREHENEYKYWIEYFSYTDNDITRLNIHPATDEEIERDYENDLKDGTEYDSTAGKGKYTYSDHCLLLQRVNEYNKANDLPVVDF